MTPDARDRFDRLIQPRLDEGYRLARWLTGNSSDAEDVVQEASLRAFRAIDTFADGNARAWFLRVVRNACYTWLQEKRSRAETFHEDLGFEEQAYVERGGHFTTPATPEAVLIGKDETAAVSRAIDDLPTVFREVVVLREVHGLSYREISEVSGAPVGTVMSRLARARQLLMTRLSAV